MESYKQKMETYKQKLVYNYLMCDPRDDRIPTIPVCQEALSIGHRLKELFETNVFSKMYLDGNAMVTLE